MSRGRVVVGYDGSEAARTAVDWAVDEAASRGTPMSVVFAADYTGLVDGPVGSVPARGRGLAGGRVDASRHVWRLAASAGERIASEGASRAREHRGDVDIRHEAITGSAKQVLIDASRDATLLVVGTRGHGNLASCMLGSVASSVAAHASCPVVIVRGDSSHEGVNRPVVVGVDGSAASDAALQFAASRAVHEGAPLVIVCAWTSVARESWEAAYWLARSGDEDPDTAACHAAEDLAAAAASHAQAGRPDLPVTVVVDKGPPSAVVLAASRRAGLIVVGARGRGAFASLVLGSVSHRVVHDAPCAVAIVRGTSVPLDGPGRTAQESVMTTSGAVGG